jgi:hypothetical protein
MEKNRSLKCLRFYSQPHATLAVALFAARSLGQEYQTAARDTSSRDLVNGPESNLKLGSFLMCVYRGKLFRPRQSLPRHLFNFVVSVIFI